MKVRSQPLTQTVRGHIIEKVTGQAIVGATVVVLDSLGSAKGTLGAISDKNGDFRIIGVPIGRRTVRVRMMSYREQLLSNIIVSSGKEFILEIALEEDTRLMKTVVVTPDTEKDKPQSEIGLVSIRGFTVEETNRYAGTWNDPSRMVANFAGVTAGDDSRNDIVVRGNSPLGVLWRVEGIDIPNPNHLAVVGTGGGFITALNTNVLANSDFLTGAFPSEYGNRMSSVFDIKLRNGNNEKHEWSAQAGLNGLELGVEGPFSKEYKGSFLAHYRLFSLDPVKALGVNLGVSGVPQFQDINFKVQLPLAKFGTLSVFGIGGVSNISMLESNRKAGDWSFSDKAQDVYFTSDIGVLGITHTLVLDSATIGKVFLSLNGSRGRALREYVFPNAPKQLKEELQTSSATLFAKYELSHKVNALSHWKVGAVYSSIGFDYYQNELANSTLKQYEVNFDAKDRTSLIQAYGNWQMRPIDGLTMNAGLYGQYFTYNNTFSIEPRVSAQYELNESQRISFGYGRHSQLLPLLYYTRRYQRGAGQTIQQNRNVDMPRGDHFVLGYDWRIAADWRFKADVYHQHLFNVPVSRLERFKWYSSLNDGALYSFTIPDSLVNEGVGRNVGIECTLEKFFTNNYYFLATVSLYDSRYRAFDGKWRNTGFNNNYAVNIVGGYELHLGEEEQNALLFDIRAVVVGGRPYIPIDLRRSISSGREVTDVENAFAERFPATNRLDLKVSYRLNTAAVNHFIFIGVNNILNSQNALQISYNNEQHSVKTEYQLGLFPTVGYRIQW